MVNDKLKKIVFGKLYEDLSHVEIIPHNDVIWFIDREQKYWYLEYQKDGTLFWRYQFFTNFFTLFSLESSDFQLIISEWVEEVLNCKVKTSHKFKYLLIDEVEEVLNCKVKTSYRFSLQNGRKVEEVLNCKVETQSQANLCPQKKVEEVLNCKVKTQSTFQFTNVGVVEEVLNCKVETTLDF